MYHHVEIEHVLNQFRAQLHEVTKGPYKNKNLARGLEIDIATLEAWQRSRQAEAA